MTKHIHADSFDYITCFVWGQFRVILFDLLQIHMLLSIFDLIHIINYDFITLDWIWLKHKHVKTSHSSVIMNLFLIIQQDFYFTTIAKPDIKLKN